MHLCYPSDTSYEFSVCSLVILHSLAQHASGVAHGVVEKTRLRNSSIRWCATISSEEAVSSLMQCSQYHFFFVAHWWSIVRFGHDVEKVDGGRQTVERGCEV